MNFQNFQVRSVARNTDLQARPWSGNPACRLPLYGRHLSCRRTLYGLAGVAIAVFLGGCADTDVSLNRFYPESQAPLVVHNTFGQLVKTNPPRAAHFVTIKLVPPDQQVLTPSSGTIEFFEKLDDLDALGALVNCLVLQPKFRGDTEKGVTPFDNAIELPTFYLDKVKIGLCNFDTTPDPVKPNKNPLRDALAKLYGNNGDKRAGRFLNGEDSDLDVWAAPEATRDDDPEDWSEIGKAKDGLLKIAFFKEEITGERIFLNPEPYLSDIPLKLPATAMHPPAIAELGIETSSDQTYSTNVKKQQYEFKSPNDSMQLTGAPLVGFLRVFFRLSDSGNSPPPVAPYSVSYKLSRVTSANSGDIRSQGEYHFDSFPIDSGGDLGTSVGEVAKKIFRLPDEDPPASNLQTKELWMYLPLNLSIVGQQSGAQIRNAGDASTFSTAINLGLEDNGKRRFPAGSYELEISVRGLLPDSDASSTRIAQFGIGPQGIHRIEWIGVDGGDGKTNLEDTQLHGGGKRLFPGKNISTGPTHKKVTARVTTSLPVPAGETLTVYFKAFDVDDPSSDGATSDIDINDISGQRNPNDNRPHNVFGNGPLGIQPSGVISHVISSGDRMAEVEYEITNLNPGNNWKIFSSLSMAEVNDVEANPSVANGVSSTNAFRYISDNSKVPAIGQQSPLLSLWRKLHVEVDSMASDLVTGTVTQIAQKIMTDDTKSWEIDQLNSFGEDWTLTVTTGSGPRNTGIDDTLSNPSRVVTSIDVSTPTKSGDPYRIEFGPFPADDSFRGDVPDPETGALEKAFGDAYVAPDIKNENSRTPWHFDFGGNDANMTTYVIRHRNVAVDDEVFWIAHLMGIYEVFDSKKSNDPDFTHASTGVTASRNHSIYFAEVLEDMARQHHWTAAEKLHAFRKVILHEIGHHFHLPHPSSCSENTHVMWAPCSDPDEDKDKNLPLIFKDSDLRIIRDFGNGNHP